jgi:hypothetical protein
MHHQTCSAPLLLFLLSACATTEPSLGELEAPNPRIANLQRAAQYPWTDDGHCVVREASNEWEILSERCYHALDRDRVRYRDVTGRCAVASAGAAAAAVGLCIFAAPEIIVGAVVVIGVVVVAAAIKEELDAYERSTSKQEPSANRRPNPKNQPDPKGSPEPFIPPNPTPEEYEEWRERCTEHYVRCTDYFAGMKEPRVYGESLCQSCSRICRRTGQWPAEVSGHSCPGG